MNIKKIIILAGIYLSITTIMSAQQNIKLQYHDPTISNELNVKEEITGGWMTNVSEAELFIYLPEKQENNGMAVVICPGGGYAGLAIDHEGHQMAQWLNEQGVAGIVLKYRMPNKHKNIPIDDAQQAIRYVRQHADKMGIKSNKIGIAGFSAGGHLAATASTRFSISGTSTRPDFSILFYPVITMETATHSGSRTNLLGDSPSMADIYTFSNEKQVNTNTPPAILLLSDDDKAVLPINSIEYYNALKKNDISAAMYIFPEGGHGWGMKSDFKYHDTMLSLLRAWLKEIEEKK